MNAKTASLIAASCDDAPAGGIAADNDGLTAQFGLVALLHGCKKCIHVYMGDLAEFGTVF
ncbi:MAG: hypothetical protein ACYDDP_03765 [Acidithiobacillus sp.]